jgi:hypothetical protein
MKKYLTAVCWSAALLVGLTACNTPRSAADKTSLELFNGKDLQGWTAISADPTVKAEDVWSVKDGCIVCQGKPVGFIYSDKVFTNFRLVVEYRWPANVKPSNSGVFSRIHEKFSAIPCCIETQLQHGNAGDVMGLQGMKVKAEQPRFFSIRNHTLAGDIAGVRKTADKEAAPGQWNRVEILAQGPQYTVWMNGQKINEAEGVEVVSGPIGLQSEGGEVHFRRVTLTPLP